jgi:prefoldin subunit 5
LDKQIALRQQNLNTINGQISAQEVKLEMLSAQVAELSAQRAEFMQCATDIASMRDDLSRLVTERDQVESTLKLLLGVIDYENVCRQRKETIDRLSEQVASIEATLAHKQDAIGQLERDSKQYLSILEQKRLAEEARERELADEQACIAKARKALDEFLEPYSTSTPPFRGASWTAAVQRMQIFFERQHVCSCCYYIERVGSKFCSRCGRECVTHYPRHLWDIVVAHTPKGYVYPPTPLQEMFEGIGEYFRKRFEEIEEKSRRDSGSPKM